MKAAFPINWQKGVNLDAADFALQDGEVRETRNLIPDANGVALERRGRMTYFRTISTEIDSAVGYPCMVAFPPFEPREFLALTLRTDKGQNLLYGGLMPSLAAASPKDFGFKQLRPSFTAVGTNLLVFNGWTVDGWQGVGFRPINAAPYWERFQFTMDGTDNTSYAPLLCTTWQSRLVLANFNHNKNMIVVSDLNAPTTFPNGVLDPIGGINRIINSHDNDELTCVREVLLTGTGTPSQTVLLCLKRYSAYFVEGVWPQSTTLNPDYSQLQVQRLSASAGCASHQTFAVTKYGVIWAGTDDVWFMPYGSRPFPVGRKIRERLKKTPTNLQFAWHAEYHNDIYRLAIYGDGVQNTEGSRGGVNGYDACDEQWWLDFRNGPPQNWQEARWFGPQVYDSTQAPYQLPSMSTQLRQLTSSQLGTYVLAKDATVDRDNLFTVALGTAETSVYDGPTLCQLDDTNGGSDSCGWGAVIPEWRPATAYAVGDRILMPDFGAPFVASAAGFQTWQCTTAGTSSASFAYGTFPAFSAASSPLTDNSVVWTLVVAEVISQADMQDYNCAPANLITGQISGGDLMTDKMYQGVEVSLTIPAPTTIALTFNGDNGTTGQTADIDKDASDPIVGTLVIGTAVLADTPKTFALVADTNSRPVSKSASIQLQENPRKSIQWDSSVTSQDATVSFLCQGVQFDIAAPPSGDYTPAELWNAFVALAAAALGIAFTVNNTTTYNAFLGMEVVGADWGPCDNASGVHTLFTLCGFMDAQMNHELPKNAGIIPVAPYSTGNLTLRQANALARVFKRRPVT